jgi:hypothetical protein
MPPSSALARAASSVFHLPSNTIGRPLLRLMSHRGVTTCRPNNLLYLEFVVIVLFPSDDNPETYRQQ